MVVASCYRRPWYDTNNKMVLEEIKEWGLEFFVRKLGGDDNIFQIAKIYLMGPYNAGLFGAIFATGGNKGRC